MLPNYLIISTLFHNPTYKISKRYMQNAAKLSSFLRPTAAGCRALVCGLFGTHTSTVEPADAGRRKEQSKHIKSMNEKDIFYGSFTD